MRALLSESKVFQTAAAQRQLYDDEKFDLLATFKYNFLSTYNFPYLFTFSRALKLFLRATVTLPSQSVSDLPNSFFFSDQPLFAFYKQITPNFISFIAVLFTRLMPRD